MVFLRVSRKGAGSNKNSRSSDAVLDIFGSAGHACHVSFWLSEHKVALVEGSNR